MHGERALSFPRAGLKIVNNVVDVVSRRWERQRHLEEEGEVELQITRLDTTRLWTQVTPSQSKKPLIIFSRVVAEGEVRIKPPVYAS